MGNFYVNITLKGPRQDEIAQYLKAKTYNAYISPTVKDITTVYEAGCDMQIEDYIKPFAEDLSRQFACAALAILNHDDDILVYWLYENGALRDDYNSEPGFFEEDPADDDLKPAGGDAKVICRAFGNAAKEEAVASALREGNDDGSKYVFAFERHEALVQALALPRYSVGLGFGYLEKGDLPPDTSQDEFLQV